MNCKSYQILNVEEVRNFLLAKFGVNGTRMLVRIIRIFANPTNKNISLQGQNILRARASKKLRVCALIVSDCKVHIYLIDTDHSTNKCPKH